jgi:uncharacterized membrane protein
MAESFQPEERWQARAALLVCAGLYVLLPSRLAVGPRWIVPILVVLLLVPISLRHHQRPDNDPWVRYLGLLLIAVVTVANCMSVGLLVHRLLDANVTQGRQLIYSAVVVWVTNVIVFGLWFWELDRGGPGARAKADPRFPDLQFPQMENPSLSPKGWRPGFVDYLYTSFANGTSFAPADAMPMTHRAKALFAAESVISLMTIAIVGARAVNILH